MTAGAWIMMCIICGVTFGGFIGIMGYALRSESRRNRARENGPLPE